MKILVFSDLHGSLENLDNVLSNFKFDRIFGLGDYGAYLEELNSRDVFGVRGNAYFDPDYEIDRIIEIEGFKILLTHGHTHNVRGSRLRLKLFAQEKGVDIVFYGHTHIALIEESDGIYLINPGSISIPYYPSFPTFIIMDVEKRSATIKILDAITFSIFSEITVKK